MGKGGARGEGSRAGASRMGAGVVTGGGSEGCRVWRPGAGAQDLPPEPSGGYFWAAVIKRYHKAGFGSMY